MTVRWKPLLFLSGLFVIVGLMGLMTMAMVMGSKGTADILGRARTERKAKKYDEAKLDYQRALKLDGKNPAIHEEVADLYDEWARQAPAEKKAELRGLYLASLTSAIKNGAKRVEPRRKMLAEAIRLDDVTEQVRWAKDLATLDPNDRDAHYVLATQGLDGTSPNFPEIRRHLAVLESETPRRARCDWIAARTAALTNDKASLDDILKKSRSITLADDAHPVDRMAMLRLRALDVANIPDASELSGPVDAVSREALAASSEPEIPSTRIARISLLIEEVQKSLIRRGQDAPASQDRLHAYAETLDLAADKIFRKSLDVKGGADLNVYLAYADHLRFRDHRDRCLAVVQQAFQSPAGTKQGTTEVAMGLHALAVESSLANAKDDGRYGVAAPHIKALLEGKITRFQALGHLFQGAIDLEKAGLVADSQASEVPKAEQSRLRGSALGHLKIAANQLPSMAEAQARYGVALILNQEPAMGRQYLQLAQRLGNLEAQYQIWTAWSVVQAGYPEDAEPMVVRMLDEVRLGRLPKALEGTLHLLNGEIHQARRSPEDLKKAVEEYGRAFANGQDATPAVELRLAQIEIMLGRPADALKRIDWLTSKGKAGPAAENLAVLTLQELKRDDDARKRLDQARAQYPESPELVVLDAAFLSKAKKSDQAEKVLSAFLEQYPDNIPVVQAKAQVLDKELGRPADARKLLGSIAERGDNSAPLVQLGLMEIEAKDFDAASRTIARVRDRWKDAATGELLDAQLALAKNDVNGASDFFDAALKKDPNNKLVQFWKARLDSRSNPEAASKALEQLFQGGSNKEVDNGLSLVAASQSALAEINSESGDLDSAIVRYKEMLKTGSAPTFDRSIRWKIVAAQVAKKDWATAKAEINALLQDPKNPPTAEELVRASTFFRLNREDDRALALVDQVLKGDPTYAGAVVTRAEILSRGKKFAESKATIQKALDASNLGGRKAPDVLFLMLAAVESTTPPIADSFVRAGLAIDRGLEAAPESKELVQAKSRILAINQGPKAATTFLEEKAKAFPKGPFRGMLLSTLAEQGDFASGELLAAEMAKEDPADVAAAVSQVQMIAGRSVAATNSGDRAGAKKLDDRASALIYEFRSKFKNEPSFVQLDSELEIRRGDTTRAIALTRDLDAISKGSAVGSLLRAQIFASKGQTREAAESYAEALAKNPRLPEARLQLARLSLRNGQTDEALRQAKFLQDADPDQPTGLAALLVEARALASQPGTSAQVQANRLKALEKLNGLIKNRPDYSDAAYLAADLQMMVGDRDKAVTVLTDALKVNPDDASALSMAIQILAESRQRGQGGTLKPDLDQADRIAVTYAENDPKGGRMMAASSGFSRAGRLDRAIPWAEKAASKLNSIPARLQLGDLLLTHSEAQTDQDKARELQTRALDQYDKILEASPDVIEAVNNKAWILHRYKDDSKKALELAQGLLQRVDPNSLPGEFYDTLGSIQEGMNRPKDAEESYKKGLGKSPDHPVLNYHMGALMAADSTRSSKAANYLKVAQAGSERLPADMAGNLPSLLKKVGE